jgi:hypothetical protein
LGDLHWSFWGGKTVDNVEELEILTYDGSLVDMRQHLACSSPVSVDMASYDAKVDLDDRSLSIFIGVVR